jgi:hypothetical protein
VWRSAAKSEFEVDLHGINQRQEPGEELLVGGMSVVGVVCGAVGEFHDAAELIALAARRGVETGGGVEDSGDSGFECVDFFKDVLLLLRSDAWFPAEGEHMDEHGISVTIAL